MNVLIYTETYITNSKEKCHSPEAKSSSPSQELASIYGTRRYNTVFTIAHHFYLILSHSNPVHHPILFPVYPFYSYLHIYACFFQVISVLRGSSPKACMYMWRSSSLCILLHLPATRSLWSKYPPQHHTFEHSVDVLSWMRPRSTTAYNNRKRIMVLRIFIFIFLDSEGEGRRYESNGSRISWGQSSLNFSIKKIVITVFFDR